MVITVRRWARSSINRATLPWPLTAVSTSPTPPTIAFAALMPLASLPPLRGRDRPPTTATTSRRVPPISHRPRPSPLRPMAACTSCSKASSACVVSHPMGSSRRSRALACRPASTTTTVCRPVRRDSTMATVSPWGRMAVSISPTPSPIRCAASGRMASSARRPAMARKVTAATAAWPRWRSSAARWVWRWTPWAGCTSPIR